LQSSKLAPAGEGGIFLTNNDEYFERAICLGDMARILELDSPAKRFAGTSFGIKTRMTPLSAAVARCQLCHLEERNTLRNANLRYLSEHLEELGFETFLSPSHIDRVYFEFLIRYNESKFGITRDLLVEALRAEGCNAALPRYPLLHQQPIFTEGHFARIARIDGSNLQKYLPDALPKTEAVNSQMIKLPSFPSANQEILDQYILAFRKVLSSSTEIMNHFAKTNAVA